MFHEINEKELKSINGGSLPTSLSIKTMRSIIKLMLQPIKIPYFGIKYN